MHPIAFHLGSVAVHWYGVLVALGFFLGLWTAGRRSLRAGLLPEAVMDLGPWLIAGSLIGARTNYVISYWREAFADRPLADVFKIWQGGLVFYGGLIGASLACILYARLKKLPLWKLADIMAPSIALGQAFGRLGCFMNGCCYGQPCGLPWAVRFPPDANVRERPTVPVHPTQVYEALLCFALYGALAWLFRRRKFDGQIFAAYLVSYAVVRSFVELFRGDYDSFHQYPLGATPAHLVSIAILAIGLVLLLLLPRQQKSVGA